MPKSLLYITTSVYIIIIIKLKAWNISSIRGKYSFSFVRSYKIFPEESGRIPLFKKKKTWFLELIIYQINA